MFYIYDYYYGELIDTIYATFEAAEEAVEKLIKERTAVRMDTSPADYAIFHRIA